MTCRPRRDHHRQRRRSAQSVWSRIQGQASVADAGELAEFDVKFPPLASCGPAGLQYSSGPVLSALPVQLLFWGPTWQTEPLLTLSQQFTAAVLTILAGPYMSGLRQYYVRRCTFAGELGSQLRRHRSAPNAPTGREMFRVLFRR